jgi:hypothetical protein
LGVIGDLALWERDFDFHFSPYRAFDDELDLEAAWLDQFSRPGDDLNLRGLQGERSPPSAITSARVVMKSSTEPRNKVSMS